MKKYLILIPMIILISTTLVDVTQGLAPQDWKLQSPIKSEIISEKTLLIIGETTEINFRAFPRHTGFLPNNTTMKIQLPEGIDLVSGDLLWNGTLTEQGNSLKIRIKANKEGNFQIIGFVISYVDGGHFGQANYLKICSGESRFKSFIICNKDRIEKTLFHPVTFILIGVFTLAMSFLTDKCRRLLRIIGIVFIVFGLLYYPHYIRQSVRQVPLTLIE